MHLRRLCPPLIVALALAACAPAFQLKNYQDSNERLYQASLAEYHKKHWDNAATGFERLTIDLPARDTLLSRSFYYLGKARTQRGEHLLAAQSFARLTESFPDDTLADDALFEAAKSYQRMWRKPVLDAQYGQSALSTYRTLLALYPNSTLREPAAAAVARLEQWFATKDYENGMHYFRRKAFDSAIIYFKDVLRNYPTAPRARDASLRLVETYRSIKYREDANEMCANLRQTYPGDREVRVLCGAATASTPAAPSPAAVPAPAAR
jgi:outer membrane protein assembly factor BamD